MRGSGVRKPGSFASHTGCLSGIQQTDGMKSGTGRHRQPPGFPDIDGYRFLQTVARSPNSEIYVAHSIELDQTVAVKILRTGSDVVAAADEVRFERERELLTRIKHPAVVDVYDWGHADHFRYFVTEYFPGGSLELRIRNLMRVSDSVDIFLQIAGALVAIHGAGLCHRDLKPANVMMRPDGRVVLIDFGLAKSMQSAVALTNAGEVRGSPFYISPEQAEGHEVDQRSDIYSLGVMFYEMLTGERPFRGATVVAILQAHRDAPIPQLPPELARFQHLIDGMLAKQPDDRFGSVRDVLAEMAKMKV